ncbi:hypothetical protein [Cyclobacterium marinum]|tara:strand:- start:28390 stop:28530 length:141 start_codon:yes stop_codon:yes gene_type:complete
MNEHEFITLQYCEGNELAAKEMTNGTTENYYRWLEVKTKLHRKKNG